MPPNTHTHTHTHTHTLSVYIGWRDSHSSSIHHSTRLSWIWNSHSAPSLCEIRRSARMRNLTALLLLLSLSSLYLVSSAPSGTDVMKTCCSNPTKVRIPLKNIVTYWKTSSSCHLQAIVFKTVVGKMLCLDPDVAWVSGHMKSVDARKNPKSKP
ncbi:C-C motif chemokine 4-like isoform X2 [Clarias gariepinus]|uniref:C-C motif chemokine 4-like isoform X2 n=1 Tax=Clarias gariepinus TaxID=13013 RepID=UPI00234DE6DE|nr:C-C motif chemokine 4-like isoform X2 [Clarias gariepinus]